MLSRLTFAAIFITLFSICKSKGESLELKQGDHVVWIGNTLAERMQYFGDIESRLHARYPNHNLIVRNLSLIHI